MNRSLAAALLLASALVAGGAHAAPRAVTDPEAPRALQANGPVSVKWEDPAKFTESVEAALGFQPTRPPQLDGLEAHKERFETVDATIDAVRAAIG